MNPKISVIVAVYNVEKYLKECLNSLIGQTLKDIEIICVNDGSTDNSWEILQEYALKDERVKIVTQTNKGPGGARNAALKIATGDFICITDADDFRAPDCLEKLYKAAIENNTDSAFGDVYIVTEKGEYYRNFIDPRPYNKVVDIKTSFSDSIYQWQSIFKREAIKDIRYIEGVDYEDGIFLYEIYITLKSTIHVKDAICYYRELPNSSCRGYTDRVFKLPMVLQHFYDLLDKYKSHEHYNYFKKQYKKYIKFLLKKCFFDRMPQKASYFKIWKLYFQMYKFMNLKQKLRCGYKVTFSFLRKK